jgi:hypothetical protein
MNQRAGKTHSAAATDNRQMVDLAALIKFVSAARVALEQEGEEDSALRFELFEDFLRNDVANGKPFGFTYKALGL